MLQSVEVCDDTVSTRRAPVAVIGMGCRLPPDITSPAALWTALRDGFDAVGPVPAGRWDARSPYDAEGDANDHARAVEGAFLREVSGFDPTFFRISPKEAAAVDPQHRLLLEVAWEALEHANIAADTLRRSPTGVFLGMGTDDYALLAADPRQAQPPDPYTLLGVNRGMAAGRIAHLLGLHGPVLQLDTTCSSSLVATHLALRSLREKECDLALAGGSQLLLNAWSVASRRRMNSLAPRARCRAFDAEAEGFGLGEGVGMVVLKRLDDALRDGDPVLAVLRGSAINHDGTSAGLTTPNPSAQEAVIAGALRDAGLRPGDIDYVEAHGTGTELGDPIEVGALQAAFGGERDSPLRIGSVKTNFGHLEAAAGVLSLMKVVLSLVHEQVPPTLHVRRLNPHIRWNDPPVVVNTELRDWPRGARERMAGVSAFGMSGTNCHVVVAEAAPPAVTSPAPRPWPFTLSAKCPRALSELAARHAAHLTAPSPGAAAPLADICAGATLGRHAFRYRWGCVADSTEDLRYRLLAFDDPAQEGFGGPYVGDVRPGARPHVAVVVAGPGSGSGTAREPTPPSEIASTWPEFASAWQAVQAAARAVPMDGERHEALTEFAWHYALCALLGSWGLRPFVLSAQAGGAAAACWFGEASLDEAVAAVLTGRTPREDSRPSDPWAGMPEDVRHVVLIGADLPVTTASSSGTPAQGDETPRTLHTIRCTDGETARRDALEVVTALYTLGLPVEWSAVQRGSRTVRLPTYPFQRRPLWLAGVPRPDTAGEPESTRPRQAEETGVLMRETVTYLRACVAELIGLDPDEVDEDVPLLDLGADSPTFVGLVGRIKHRYGIQLSVRQFFEELPTVSAIAERVVRAAAPGKPAAVEPGTGGGARAESGSLPADEPGQGRDRATDRVSDTAHADELSRLQREVEQLRALLERQASDPEVAPAAEVAPEPEAAPGSGRAAGPGPAAAPVRTGHGSGAQRYLHDVIDQHLRNTRGSLERSERHQGGLTSNRRNAFGRLSEMAAARYPIWGQASRAGRLWDVDGNEYVDLAMGFGSHLLGHSPDVVQEALRTQLDAGIHLGPEGELSGEVAEKVRLLTGVERVNFCVSGTEAVMTAMRLARAATGRSRIALFANAYHGHFDGTLVTRGLAGTAYAAAPQVPGVTQNLVDDMVVLPFNRPESLRWLTEHGHELAAVVTEPVQNRDPGEHAGSFLRELRRITRDHGALLVLDEVLTGFRIAPGGGQAWFQVPADLVTYGKTLAAGLPMAAVGGRAEILGLVDGGSWVGPPAMANDSPITYTAGTYVKHPLALAAANAVLGHLVEQGPALQERLNERAAELIDDLNDCFTGLGVPLSARRFGSFFRFVHSGNYSFVYQPMQLDLLRLNLARRGVFLVETGSCFLSTAHTDKDIDQVRAAVTDAVTEMRDAGVWEARPGVTSAGSARSAASAGSAVVNPEAQAESRPRSEPLPHSEPRLRSEPRPRSEAPLCFSLSFFGSPPGVSSAEHHELVLDGARFADRSGFQAVWLPERHFHQLGGFSPNPAVLAAALAQETERLHIRAGSVVLPLHHPLRVAEEWAVVDSLSGGRAGIAFASGWNDQDFVLAPEAFGERKAHTLSAMAQVRALWRGESVRFAKPDGTEVPVQVFPRPVQPELPVWLTALGSEETFKAAGRHGVGILTNLLSQDIETLRAKVTLYRQALADAGHDPRTGHVAVLLHTMVGDDHDTVLAAAREPLRSYLRSAADLQSYQADPTRRVDLGSLSEDDQEFLIDQAFNRYVRGRSLVGTPESCRPVAEALAEAGVDEIACFVDFGATPDVVRAGFAALDQLRKETQSAREGAAGTEADRPAVTITPVVPGKTPDEGGLPLTEVQRLTWSRRAGTGTEAAHQHVRLVRLTGELDRTALERALRDLTERHEALRLVFGADGEEQRLLDAIPVTIPLTDLSHLDGAELRTAVEAWAADAAREPLAPERGPLLRARLLRETEGEHTLALTVHHLVADSAAVDLLLDAWGQAYGARRTGKPASTPRDAPLRTVLERLTDSSAEAADRAYWRERLPAGADPVPAALTPPSSPTADGRRTRVPLPGTLRRRVRRLASECHTTPYLVLVSVYARLLHRISGHEELVVGVRAARRAAGDGLDSIVFPRDCGLPVRSVLRPDDTPRTHLRALHESVAEAIRHAGSDAVVPLAGTAPAASFHWHHQDPPSFPGLRTRLLDQERPSVRDALELHVVERGDTYTLDWLHHPEVLDEAVVREFAQRYTLLLDDLVPAQPPSSATTGATAGARDAVSEEGPWVPQLIEEFLRDPSSGHPEAAGGEAAVSRAMLAERIGYLAGVLAQRGLEPGSVAEVRVREPRHLLVAACAVLLLGGTVGLPGTGGQADGGAGPARDLLVTDRPEAMGDQRVVLVSHWEFGVKPRTEAAPIRPGDLALGGTGERLTHAALAGLIREPRRADGAPGLASAQAGLVGALAALLAEQDDG
ncbi:MAG: aminotransferase class III-fold pyridoxal phosphate-dependent enzyme, partial [Streptomyces sp.]|nr:aminotransferase class III-fold pyridoxal phosphate-dependent enzyme [Streptomyces sp.]